jgi:hypothetical protein
VEGLNKRLGTRLLVSVEVLREVSGFVLRLLGEFLLAGKSGLSGSPRCSGVPEIRLWPHWPVTFKSFQSRRWNDTVALLEAVLRQYPNDGPSHYCPPRALRLRTGVEEPSMELVARVDKN